MSKLCEFSPCRKYRYTLWRDWPMELGLDTDPDRAALSKHYVQFIGLNPSTADDTQDDPTMRRCIDFAKRWGYGAFCMTNLFAFRATDPRDMKAHATPIGDENDRWIAEIASGAHIVIAAWGNDGVHLDRAARVMKALPLLHCLKVTNTGQPSHPLYLPSSLKPIIYHSKTT